MNIRIIDLLPWCFLLFVFGVSFSIVAAHIALGIWLLLWLVSLALKQTHWKRTPLDVPVLIFLGIDLITAILGVNPAGSLVHFVSLWHIAIYFLVVNTITERHWIERSLLVLFVAVGLNAGYGIVQHFWDGMYFFRDIEETARWSIENRELGTFSHSMTFAGQMTMVGLMGLALLTWWKKFPGMGWWGIPVVVILFAWVFSYTRGAWVGGVAGMIALAALKGKRAIIGICIGVTLLIVLISSFEENFLSRIKSIADPNNHSNFTRINMIKVTYEMFKESPFLGVGSGNYGEVSEPYRLRYGVANASHPHNNLLTQVAEKGLLGLSAFLYIWVVFFRESWFTLKTGIDGPQRALVAGGFAALVGIQIAGLFESNFGDSEVAMMMWLIVGLVMYVRVRGEEEKSVGESLLIT